MKNFYFWKYLPLQDLMITGLNVRQNGFTSRFLQGGSKYVTAPYGLYLGPELGRNLRV